MSYVQGVPSLIIGHHLLTGRVTELEKPLAVLAKRSPQAPELAQDLGKTVEERYGQESGGGTEYEIVALVRRKLIFKNRPKPIITSTLPVKHT